MRRLLLAALVAAAASLLVIAASGAGGEDEPVRYELVFDNAFGLTIGADAKVAGVRAGSVSRLDVERGSGRALVTVEISEPGFDRLRRDAFCEISPQSLIGEYFVDCQPGTRGAPLPDGGRLPVERTAETIPPDAVAGVLRRPQREQLRIILSEFGAGLAARGEDLNTAIRRGVPALRETERVLELLAANRQRLRELARDSSVVLRELERNRRGVARFVDEARDSAAASAQEGPALAGTIRRLPTFLRELRPTLALLGTAADRQTPALADLRAAAAPLRSFLELVAPFSNASLPALRSLGQASRTGLRAVRAAAETVSRLRNFGGPAQEVGGNLAMVLEHLDDRGNAVEPNKNAPDPKQGFTGLEAFLQYPFTQTLAINIFDQRGYSLKLNALINECGGYRDAESVKDDPALAEFCAQSLGPNQPGVTTPDPTAGTGAPRARRGARARTRGEGRAASPAAGTKELPRGKRLTPPLAENLAPLLDYLLR